MFKQVLAKASRPLSRQCRVGPATVSRRAASSFNWEDPLAAQELFTEEEQAIQETARSYCQERMLPRVLGN